MVGAFVFPDGILRMTEASATRRFFIPITLQFHPNNQCILYRHNIKHLVNFDDMKIMQWRLMGVFFYRMFKGWTFWSLYPNHLSFPLLLKNISVSYQLAIKNLFNAIKKVLQSTFTNLTHCKRSHLSHAKVNLSYYLVSCKSIIVYMYR